MPRCRAGCCASEPLDVVRRAGEHDLAAFRRHVGSSKSACGEPARYSSASRSASSRPPSDTSCASVSTGAAFQTKRTSAASAARSRSPGAVATRTTSPLRHAPGRKRTSGTSPTQPTTGVGGIDRPSVSLYSETLPETTGMPRALAAAAMPSIACSSSHPIAGFSGLPKLRQSVSASGSPPAHATLRAAPSTASTPARNGSRSPGGGSLERDRKAAQRRA